MKTLTPTSAIKPIKNACPNCGSLSRVYSKNLKTSSCAKCNTLLELPQV